ncbi:HD-GYP domain-containing protein [Treponema sp.]|uniref:HD-GYP domain-containing protein n=1 Tax=Treponema sp. TaxID=166 RepID=UPI00298E132C|nr:HD domain-containing phosphohydrolase [Treponema sp.]
MKSDIKVVIKKEMKNSSKKLLSCMGLLAFAVYGIILIATPTSLYSATKKTKTDAEKEVAMQEDDIILSKTNGYYNKGYYLKAVEEINISIEQHQETDDISDSIKLMGEASYYAWINSLYKNSKVLKNRDYKKIIFYLTVHPEVMSTRISTLVEEIFHNQKIILESEKINQIERNNNRAVEKIRKKIFKLEREYNDLVDVINEDKTVEEIRMAIKIENDYQRSRNIKYMMMTLYCLIFITLIALIVFIHNNHRKTIRAQEQFETTMKVVAILKTNVDDTESPYSPLTMSEITKENSRAKGRSGKRSGLSDFESEKIAVAYFDSPDAKKNFLELQHQCIELGERIDRATGRKRNSKKVSELVFKLCKAAGVDDELSLIYYCAAMVYDAGFLSVPRNILQGEHLTIKERYEVRSHVQKAGEYYSFIPDDVRRIFLDAAEFHHENMDGKGYLAGLSNSKIPLIARFIRVAESYISLVNSRSYKKIMDTESALKELGKKGGIYDPKIIALLEKIV